MYAKEVLILIFAFHSSLIVANSNFKLSIIHINDFHARYEEITPFHGVCGENNNRCIGGFSRMYTVVSNLYRMLPNPISLNAGDNFQGTPWYTIFKWNVTQFFLNLLPIDAMTLGNHEFDDGINGLIPFLKSMKAPFVVCNINDTLEPDIQGLYRKSVVKRIDGKKIGIVGVISTGTKEVSYTGKLSFLDESTSVNSEARRLLDEEGVFTVIVLSHCAYELDKEIARRAVPGISLIVGGHSHTLLYNGTAPIGRSSGNYPTVIKSIQNETVLVVQADAFSRYVGNLSIQFDADGRLKSWQGNPIYLRQSIPQNEYVNTLLRSYKTEIKRIGDRILGQTNVLLENAPCFYSECNLGNLIADSMVARSDNNSRSEATIGIINSGGIRSWISEGNISFKDLLTVLPFGDKIIYGELLGKDLKFIMETLAAPSFYRKIDLDINLMQVSGVSVKLPSPTIFVINSEHVFRWQRGPIIINRIYIKYCGWEEFNRNTCMRLIFDQTRPIGSRVASMKILRRDVNDPMIFDDVDLSKYYPIAITTYLSRGGDNHKILKDNLRNYTEGPPLLDAVSDYIGKLSPLTVGLDGRIVVKGRKV